MRRAPALALVLLSTVAVWYAGDLDPYLLNPTVPILPLPSPVPLVWARVIVMDLALALAAMALARRGPTRPTAVALTIASLAMLFLSTPFVPAGSHVVSVVLAVLGLVALAMLLLPSRTAGAGSRVAENAATACLATGLAALLAEGAATLHPATHAVGYTLAARHWYERYWTLDERGYRDGEREREPGRRVYVLGDSFVAGIGIADPEDRFSNILHRRLAPEFRVFNLGENGSNTQNEYLRLALQPPPDLLVLSYYTNDIREACEASGRRLPPFTPYGDLGWPLGPLVRRSYLLDALYWRVPRSDLAGYEGTLEACLEDPATLQVHLRDLGRFVAYARNRRIPFVVVAFPHLVDTERTRRQIAPVIDTFRSHDVPVLDVALLLNDMPLAERIVNPNDAHPSRELNRRVAESLLDLLRTSGRLDTARARR